MEEVFDFLFSDDLEGKELAVLFRGYIDDSKDGNQEKVVVSACLIGKCDHWRDLVRPWKALLAENNLNYYKSSECGYLEVSSNNSGRANTRRPRVEKLRIESEKS